MERESGAHAISVRRRIEIAILSNASDMAVAQGTHGIGGGAPSHADSLIRYRDK